MEEIAPPFAVETVKNTVSSLELFHGPTLAFKDFGARFMARCLEQIAGDRKITILTATSGDTGAAVAHAFFGLKNINVCVLYPKGKVSPLQEKLFCTLGGNIRTVAVRGTFDDCQALVKEAFDDEWFAVHKECSFADSKVVYFLRCSSHCRRHQLQTSQEKQPYEKSLHDEI